MFTNQDFFTFIKGFNVSLMVIKKLRFPYFSSSTPWLRKSQKCCTEIFISVWNVSTSKMRSLTEFSGPAKWRLKINREIWSVGATEVVDLHFRLHRKGFRFSLRREGVPPEFELMQYLVNKLTWDNILLLIRKASK